MTNSSSSPITPHGAKVVSFCSSVKVKKTKHFNDYTAQEIQDCWYSPKEAKIVRSQALQMAKQLEDPTTGYIKTSEYSRGLEILSSQSRRTRMEKRYQVWDAVLDEQELQRTKGIRDDETIASIYSACCYESALAALTQGYADQHDVYAPSRHIPSDRRVPLTTESITSPLHRELVFPSSHELYQGIHQMETMSFKDNGSAFYSQTMNHCSASSSTALQGLLMSFPIASTTMSPQMDSSTASQLDNVLSILEQVENVLVA